MYRTQGLKVPAAFLSKRFKVLVYSGSGVYEFTLQYFGLVVQHRERPKRAPAST